MLYGEDLICEGTLKKYDVENQLAKEHHPLRTCQDYPKPPREATGVEFEEVDHLLGEHWYSLCERQNLQYGPMFQTVVRYGIDRCWCDIRWGPSPTLFGPQSCMLCMTSGCVMQHMCLLSAVSFAACSLSAVIIDAWLLLAC